MIIETTDNEERSEVLEILQNGKLLLMFYTDWCPYSAQVTKILTQLEQEENGNFHFVKVNLEKNPKTANFFHITGIPTVIAVDHGKVLAMYVGQTTEDDYRKLICEKLLSITSKVPNEQQKVVTGAVTISLCMIVKDEEETLERCLNSVASLVDEIIIVDTGSTDSTIKIAKKFTDKVYTFDWNNDFSAARNFSFSLATKEYCMWMDADDVLESSQHEAFRQLKNSLTQKNDNVLLKYDFGYDQNGKVIRSEHRNRIVKNDGTHTWIGPIHEILSEEGNIMFSEIAVSHRKIKPYNIKRNIAIFRKVIENGGVLDAKNQFFYARDLYSLHLYQEAIDMFLIFFDMPKAWLEHKIMACQFTSECYERLDNPKKALTMLFQSFEYDLPRAEICCDIGRFFLTQHYPKIALFWYQKALETDKEKSHEGFANLDCYDFIPYIQLCFCYEHLGDRQKAIEYNEKAGQVKPDSVEYLTNKAYFNSKSR